MTVKTFEISCELGGESLGFAFYKEGTTPQTIHICVGGKYLRVCENCYDLYTVKVIEIINNIRSANNLHEQITNNDSQKKRNPGKVRTW